MKCLSCGRDFGGAQALASHVRHVCGKALVVRQAEQVVRAATQGQGAGPKTLDPRVLTQGSENRIQTQDSRVKTLGSRVKTLDSGLGELVGLDLDLDAYERRVRRLELREKLKARELEARGRNMRLLAIALVVGGIFVYIRWGGKLKLPFFGQV